MSDARHTPTSATPFGSDPTKRRWPLVGWIVAFAAWFLILFWLALVYPAR
jgi:hypothetical protein